MMTADQVRIASKNALYDIEWIDATEDGAAYVASINYRNRSFAALEIRKDRRYVRFNVRWTVLAKCFNENRSVDLNVYGTEE